MQNIGLELRPPHPHSSNRGTCIRQTNCRAIIITFSIDLIPWCLRNTYLSVLTDWMPGIHTRTGPASLPLCAQPHSWQTVAASVGTPQHDDDATVRVKVLRGFGKREGFQLPDQDGKKGIELLPHLPAYFCLSVSVWVQVCWGFGPTYRKTWIKRQPNSLCTPSSSAARLLNLLPRSFCGLSLILSFYFPAVRPSGCCFTVVGVVVRIVILIVSTSSNYSIDVIVRPAFGIYCCADLISSRSWSFNRSLCSLARSFLGHHFRRFDWKWIEGAAAAV